VRRDAKVAGRDVRPRVAPRSEIPCEWRKARRTHVDRFHHVSEVSLNLLAGNASIFACIKCGVLFQYWETVLLGLNTLAVVLNDKSNKICVCRKYWNCFVNYSWNLENYKALPRDVGNLTECFSSNLCPCWGIRSEIISCKFSFIKIICMNNE